MTTLESIKAGVSIYKKAKEEVEAYQPIFDNVIDQIRDESLKEYMMEDRNGENIDVERLIKIVDYYDELKYDLNELVWIYYLKKYDEL